MNGYWQKWLFFITSYFPLYCLMIFGKLDYSNDIWFQVRSNYSYFFVLVVFILISIIHSFVLLKGDGSETKKLPKEMAISPESESLMNYVITYITPLLSLKIEDKNSVITNAILFLVIGLIYVGSSATFLNPLLGILGYKIFGVNNLPGAHHLISKLSFDELEKARNNQELVVMLRIGEGVYTIKEKREKNNLTGMKRGL
ncbi:hypothetical protein [Lapidilactobacillus luobeiensis]|uniref:hypothetical protein n=1 Tax=Lapidilactobacillus luobeiensis TaxID=2950371 RepID=UPI0021C27C3B|nr:hypothetical protein [Lapidilactobacillus luobeiensis]